MRGIDIDILGGHTHDGVPGAIPVKNAGGRTLVTNAGSNSKFLGVFDFDVRMARLQTSATSCCQYSPTCCRRCRDGRVGRAKFARRTKRSSAEKLATTDAMLYRRGNFNGSFDQLILDALMEVKGAEIGFSPGFRWGTSLLSGQAITREHLMDQTAITYPYTTVTDMSGEMIKTVLEDVADNLFNPDPYYQQGGDMVRVGGLQYTIDPLAAQGKRITEMRLKGTPIDAAKTYKVAGWAPVSEAARDAAIASKTEPVWDVVETWLKSKSVSPPASSTCHASSMPMATKGHGLKRVSSTSSTNRN